MPQFTAIEEDVIGLNELLRLGSSLWAAAGARHRSGTAMMMAAGGPATVAARTVVGSRNRQLMAACHQSLRFKGDHGGD